MASIPARSRARSCAARVGKRRNKIRVMESRAVPLTRPSDTLSPSDGLRGAHTRIEVGFFAAALPAFLVIALQTLATAQPTPLIHAHAHNDYEHTRPLLDALDHGFCSVEADIYLVDGKLLVAHDRSKVKAERTLQSLYLDPLRERVRKNGE